MTLTERTSQVIRLAGPICYQAVRAFGLPAINRRLQDAGLILCYHNVVAVGSRALGDPGLHMPRDRFEQQIRWLAAHYSVIGLGEFVDRLAAGKSLRAVAALTFDDGYSGVFEHAVPVLRAAGLPATVFVVGTAGRSTGFWWDQKSIVESTDPSLRRECLNTLRGDETAIVSGDTREALPVSHRPADWDLVRAAIHSGITIGAHTVTHRSLPTLTDAELDFEVVTGRTMIERATGTHPDFFAYPYGLWDYRVRSRVRLAGYRAGLTLNAGLNRPFADPCSLRRLNVPAEISGAAFEAWAAGLTIRQQS
jgi:peptidoglycan/xylan/chitin deacetylase (PgdA/CDA1 family)